MNDKSANLSNRTLIDQSSRSDIYSLNGNNIAKESFEGDLKTILSTRELKEQFKSD